MAKTIFFDQVLESAGIDSDAGIVKGVSVITSGVTARGHDLEVDDTTIMQMFEKCVEKGQVAVKWNHKTGADAVNGYLKDFRIEGNKLKADWHLLKSHERYEHAMEMAEKMPQNVGLSASFLGKDVTINGRKHARCSDVISVDLVSSPAANPDGLFQSKVDSKDNIDMENDLKELKALISGVATELSAIKSEQEAQRNEFAGFQVNLHEFLQADPEDEEPEGEEEEGEEEGEEPTTELARLEQCVRHLSAKFLQSDEREAQHELDSAFAGLDDRITQLEEINQQLSFENAAMADALKEFEEMTGTTVEFAAGREGYVPVVHGSGENAATDFEARVLELEAGGKVKTDAIMFAVKEDTGRYQKHLSSLRERNLG
jgi:hypothetical protein